MRTPLFSLLITAAALGACGDNSTPPAVDPDAGTVDAKPAFDAVPEPDAGPNGPTAPPAVGLAVVSSDYVASSLSILDAAGAVAKPDCLHSGSKPPGSTLALSGDVGLPSQPLPGNPIVAIDHSNGTLTWIDPATCAPTQQLDVSTRFYANPHDVVGIRQGKAYVTRYERNGHPTADAGDFDDGDDLLIIDPSVPAVTGRIDLSSYAVGVSGAKIQARPDRAILADGTVYVSLGNLSGNFQAAATGRLVLIDPGTDQVKGVIDMTGLKNCGTGITYIPASHTLVVTCAGAYGDGARQVDGSGVIFIDAAAQPPVEKRRVKASVFGRPLTSFAAAQGGAYGFGVTPGQDGGPLTDQLWILDVMAGTAKKVVDASKEFTFAGIMVDPVHERAYLTDGAAAAPRIRVYEYANPAAPTQATSFDASSALHLPPREVARY